SPAAARTASVGSTPPSARTRSPPGPPGRGWPTGPAGPPRTTACSPRRSRPRGSWGRRAAGRSGSRPPSARHTRHWPAAAHTSSGQSTAGCRFFESLANRFGADSVDQAQDDHLVGQQLQGPVAAALGRVAAGEPDELLLDIPLDLDLAGS